MMNKRTLIIILNFCIRSVHLKLKAKGIIISVELLIPPRKDDET